MKISHAEILSCDAGWRNYFFLMLETDNGIQGWSEFDESYGSLGLSNLVRAHAERLIGRDPRDAGRIRAELSGVMRPLPTGPNAQVRGAIENALLDLQARAYGVPVHELLGGKVRDTVPLYWSHCASWSIGHPEHYSPEVRDLDDVAAAAGRARAAGFSALKSNMFDYQTPLPSPWMSGFGSPYAPELPVSRRLVRDVVEHVMALRRGAGDDAEILIDLNCNARFDGFKRLFEGLSELDLYWIELDIRNPQMLAELRHRSSALVASCETLCGLTEFREYFEAGAVDIAIVDAVWNGVRTAVRIADLAESFGVSVAPHNFYSHLATMMSVHFAAVAENVAIMENDCDRLAWDDELFDHSPEISGGSVRVPDGPGWGIAPDLDAVRAHPPRPHSFLGLQ